MKTLLATRPFPLRRAFLFLPLLSFLALYGCGEEEGGNDKDDVTAGLDSTVTPLVNYHPILDRNVRPGDSMIVDLAALIEEGLILETDMRIIGMYVQGHGGVERTDSVVTGMTYRTLLDRALVRDMSRGAVPCDGCNDSIIIMVPENSSRIYLGKGRKSLQKMIREGLKETEEHTSDSEAPFNMPVKAENWQETIRAAMQKRENIDWVLVGNTIILLNRDGKKLSDYTYGRILAVVDEVRDMEEFEDVQTLFEQTRTGERQQP